MKLNVTRESLIAYAQEVQQMQGSILFYFLSSKIREFNNNNYTRVKTIREGQDEIQKKYFVYDEKGSIVFEETGEGDSKQRLPKIVEGKTMEEFTAMMRAYLSGETVMDV